MSYNSFTEGGIFNCIKNNKTTMKLFIFVGVIFLLYIFLSMNNNKKKISGGNNSTTFILYYVDWCPHCKTVKPEWEKLENDKSLENVTIKKINCEENEKAAIENNIEGFPTILFTHNNKVESYEGGREYSDFKEFLNSKNL
tara:strand:+ start:379 stop:801 length:423 start_codon:yes stop_codon:yes gene_type:complete